MQEPVFFHQFGSSFFSGNRASPMDCKEEQAVIKKELRAEPRGEALQGDSLRPEKEKRKSGKSNWEAFNARRLKEKTERLKVLNGIPVRRLSFKQKVGQRRIIHDNVYRLESGPVETVSRGTQTDQSV